MPLIATLVAAVSIGQPVVFKEADGETIHCAGAVVARTQAHTWVVTAAHCVKANAPAQACVGATCKSLEGQWYFAFTASDTAYVSIPEIATEPTTLAPGGVWNAHSGAWEPATREKCDAWDEGYCSKYSGLKDKCDPKHISCFSTTAPLQQCGGDKSPFCDTDSGGPYFEPESKMVTAVLTGVRRDKNGKHHLFLGRLPPFNFDAADCAIGATPKECKGKFKTAPKLPRAGRL